MVLFTFVPSFTLSPCNRPPLVYFVSLRSPSYWLIRYKRILQTCRVGRMCFVFVNGIVGWLCLLENSSLHLRETLGPSFSPTELNRKIPHPLPASQGSHDGPCRSFLCPPTGYGIFLVPPQDAPYLEGIPVEGP